LTCSTWLFWRVVLGSTHEIARVINPKLNAARANWVVVVRNTKTGIGTYLSTSETVPPYSDFVGLVAGQYEISEAFSVRHICTTHTVRTTVVAGETNLVFIGVKLLI
jgi:hypothetical protein